MTTLAVDLGGTRLKAARMAEGEPVDLQVVEHGGRWLAALREAVTADELLLCVPGLVHDGRVVSLPGKLPGIENADLAELLGARIPVLVNDAIAYGIGEAVHGAGAGSARVLVMTLGTGVGVAVVEDGEPLGRGALGGGVLGGQLPLEGAAGTDTAGRSGTIEAFCRADALAEHGIERYRADLVRALTALCLAHAPDCVVVGGGGAAAPRLLDGVAEAVRRGLWPGQSVEVRAGSLGDAAALVGLAHLHRTQVQV